MTDSSIFPTTRETALERLETWLNGPITHYAKERNIVLPGHPNVSRLSAALQRRVITEAEVMERTLENYQKYEVDKFLCEVAWRLYWKSWLEMRPTVWDEYREAVKTGREEWGAVVFESGGSCGIGIIDYFARELIETGYLHNHARMWFAAWWVHEARLPWEQGADFFLCHLRDGDPASNTLSWRWVAGLHTRGKTYLARRSNLEKNIVPEILEPHSEGLRQLENPVAREDLADRYPGHEWQAPAVETLDRASLGSRGAFWAHSEDRSAKSASDFADLEIAVEVPEGCEINALPTWAHEQGVTSIVAPQPWVGPLSDQIPALREALGALGISLHLHRRLADRAWLEFGTAGFFGFWKKYQKHVLSA